MKKLSTNRISVVESDERALMFQCMCVTCEIYCTTNRRKKENKNPKKQYKLRQKRKKHMKIK